MVLRNQKTDELLEKGEVDMHVNVVRENSPAFRDASDPVKPKTAEPA